MLKRILLSAAIVAITTTSIHARTVNVHGKVTLNGTNEPLYGITIYNGTTEKLLGITNEEGRYAVTLDSSDDLLFSSMNTKELREPLNGRLQVNVELMPEANELEEIVVTAEGGNSSLETEPTDINVQGNTLLLKTSVKIPKKIFSSEKRMIVQPALYNVTRRHLQYMTPVVYDGKRYAITQDRMLDHDMTKDPLHPYQQIKTTGRNAENRIILNDSAHVENPDEDFMFIVISSLENYNRILYADTFELARGTVNPLRFLSYTANPSAMNEDKFKPLPEVELRDSKGEMHLTFPVGKSKLDMSLGNNAAEMQAMLSEFSAIENDPDMTLKSFSISGYSSPEGRYESNLRLARARVNSAMTFVMESINPELSKNAEKETEAIVAPWDDIVTLLQNDGYSEEADALQDVIDRYKNVDSRSVAVTRLKFYRSLIVQQYLPQLRRVNYTISYSRYRPLTDEEIATIYAKTPAKLSKYQYYRLYTSLEGAEREAVIRQALASHPDFVVAATDLANIMLSRDENPSDVLEPFCADKRNWDKLPQATLYNMGLCCLRTKNYTRADSLLSKLPDTPEFHTAKIYSKALNGKYQQVMTEICEDSPINEVVLLLALKDNAQAWKRAQKLGDSANEEYVKAIAANRVDEYLQAVTHLQNALRQDPTLIEVAKIDGDIVGILDDTDLNSTATPDNE